MGYVVKHFNSSLVDGQTPLDEEEKEDLILKNISTKEELDEFEQKNIEAAHLWLAKKRFKNLEILSERFILDLHYQMLKNVWLFAGKFRKTNKNLGVDSSQIAVELRKLLDDTKYWIENRTFNSAEIAIRLKHRLVFIHPFCNGNGRHSRLMADLTMEKIFKKAPFSWGGDDLVFPSSSREAYIKAIRKADQGDFNDLISFAKS